MLSRPLPRGLATAARIAPAGPLYALAVVTADAWLALAAAAVVVLPVVTGRRRIEIACAWPRPVSVGDDVPFTVTARNAGGRVIPGMTLVERTPGFAPIEIAVPPLRAGESAAVTTTRRAIARTAGFAAVDARCAGFFAGSRHVSVQPSAPPIVVRPRPVPYAADAAAAPRPRAAADERPAARGLSVTGARPWRAGDPASAVHWRSTARAGRPIVLERADDVAAERVLVVCDAGHGAGWEAAVAGAAGVLVASARDGTTCRIVAAPPATAPSTARVDVDAGLDWLAGLRAAGRLTPAQVAAVVAAGRGGATVHVLADTRSEEAAAVIAAVTAAGGRAARLDGVGPR